MITDQTIIRRIKNTPQFKAQKEMLEIQRREKIDEIVKNFEEENDKFINIYKLSSAVETLEEFEDKLNQLKPQKYDVIPYDLPCPTEQEVREELEEEAKKNVKASFFTIKKMRKQYYRTAIYLQLRSQIIYR